MTTEKSKKTRNTDTPKFIKTVWILSILVGIFMIIAGILLAAQSSEDSAPGISLLTFGICMIFLVSSDKPTNKKE